MGESSNFMQELQLQKGRQDSRRSRYAAFLERLLYNSLSEIYIINPICINSKKDLERWGIDPDVFELIFPEWKKIVVDRNGVLVSWE